MWRARWIGITACVAAFGLYGPVTAWAHDEGEWNDQADEHFASGDPASFENLDAYGDWMWEPAHGRVWRPRVDDDWRPYWRGHWNWRGTWTWVSADPWGDVPFHYGDWVWSERLGWVWVPGAVWSPARVTWIVEGALVAWAPASVQIRIGSAPQFWVYADREHFNHPIVRPYRPPPWHRHVHYGAVVRDLDRVIVPHRPPARERTFKVSAERRDIARQGDHSTRRFTGDPANESGRDEGTARGFGRRHTR